MYLIPNTIFFIYCFIVSYCSFNENFQPTVLVCVLVRNKEHSLPYFFSGLEKLNYPKERISIWIRSDHNIDYSIELLSNWVEKNLKKYHSIDFEFDRDTESYDNEFSESHWPKERFERILILKQEALLTARKIWADYILYIDADVYIVNRNLLISLIIENKTIISPMLNITGSKTYSNFWCGMDENGYYVRTDEYIPILFRHRQGCFEVKMIHSIILIDLRKKESELINYWPIPHSYIGDIDDIIIFARLIYMLGIKMYLLNNDYFGWMAAPIDFNESSNLSTEKLRFEELLLQVATYTNHPLTGLQYMLPERGPTELIGFDKIYLINLKKRKDRLNKMHACLHILNLNASRFEAYDGSNLNEKTLKELGIKMLDGYRDPYKGRSLTMGEIGCFLSHYAIWKDIVDKGYQRVIILEDDVKFRPNFKKNVNYAVKEADQLEESWDLIYLGRKRLENAKEYYVNKENSKLVWVDYTYWTIGYALTRRGATKLLNQNPLSKMIAVDEYLPIMYNRHPNVKWSQHFQPKNLIALSIHPLVIEPTHYTGEIGYITDTENSKELENLTVTDFTNNNDKQPDLVNIRGDDNNIKSEKKSRLFGDL